VHGRIQSPAAFLSEQPGELPPDLPEQVSRALHEDIGSGDVTAELIAGAGQTQARVLCREPAVLCGAPWFDVTFRQLDPALRIDWQFADGDRVPAGSILCVITGAARPILTGERTALNFLQLLSATATVTRRYADALAGTSCRILDTRKTIPGLRSAQKYAVRCGGGANHRLGLYDMVLIKENHIAAAGSIVAAIDAARRRSAALPIEVEVENIEQLRQALSAGADRVLLDNFELAALQAAVALNRAQPKPALLEASGGVTLERIAAIAATGVDYISAGALTKDIHAIDLSMRIGATAS
jgi:nicotinate-nucleotide pyrophosphorylase (carboxylating)